MTAPRFIVPGHTYLLTRRCSERRFFLRPDEKTTRIFLYCLAEAAARFGIRVLAWIAMSNHYHAVVEDPDGTLPRFLAHFHKLSARCLNARWGRWENLWAAEQAGAVRLVEHRDVLDKVVYTLANSVAGHLVERALEWPGACSIAALDGRQIRIERPTSFFREDGIMPRTISLEAQVPRAWPGGREAWTAAVRDGVRRAEEAAKRDRAATGSRVVGARAIRDASPTHQPTTREPRRGLRPLLACRNVQRRIAELRALKWFRSAYADARALFIEGLDVRFPWGTYKLVHELGARCHPAPA